jgi:hypothetical protein
MLSEIPYIHTFRDSKDISDACHRKAVGLERDRLFEDTYRVPYTSVARTDNQTKGTIVDGNFFIFTYFFEVSRDEIEWNAPKVEFEAA